MGVCWATDTVGSIPNWIRDWAADAAVGTLIEVSVCWASLADILGWIPSQWSNADQTFLSGWVKIASFRTNTHISCIIIN